MGKKKSKPTKAPKTHQEKSRKLYYRLYRRNTNTKKNRW